jgi:hypothetical protein
MLFLLKGIFATGKSQLSSRPEQSACSQRLYGIDVQRFHSEVGLCITCEGSSIWHNLGRRGYPSLWGFVVWHIPQLHFMLCGKNSVASHKYWHAGNMDCAYSTPEVRISGEGIQPVAVNVETDRMAFACLAALRPSSVRLGRTRKTTNVAYRDIKERS